HTRSYGDWSSDVCSSDLITPFNKDGSVDFAAFRALLKFQQDNGTSAVLIMGSTGETSMLAPEEKTNIIVECAKMKTSGMPIFFRSEERRVGKEYKCRWVR